MYQQAGRLSKPQTFSRAPKCGSENILFPHTSCVNQVFQESPQNKLWTINNRQKKSKTNKSKTSWWFWNIFCFYPYLGKGSILTNNFQLGWFTHHLEQHFGQNKTKLTMSRTKNGWCLRKKKHIRGFYSFRFAFWRFGVEWNVRSLWTPPEFTETAGWLVGPCSLPRTCNKKQHFYE